METTSNRVCPVWAAYTLLIPLRKFQHDPQKILSPYVTEGMRVMDYGCAMGWFSIPLAKMTGAGGTVYCVDIQEKMLEKLEKRASSKHLSGIVRPLLVGGNYNPAELTDRLDFVLLFAVVHEVPDKRQLFNDIFGMLKAGGKVLFAEPKGHVSPEDFRRSVDMASLAGLAVSPEKPLDNGLSCLLVKEKSA